MAAFVVLRARVSKDVFVIVLTGDKVILPVDRHFSVSHKNLISPIDDLRFLVG